jgi:hypothetical protein
MKLKIVNKTDWHTADLKRIAHAALVAAGARPFKFREVTVYVNESQRRSGRVHGKAWIGRHIDPQNWVLFLPTPERAARHYTRELLKRIACQVAHHEALHAVGARHADMTDEQRYCTQAVPWADGLVLRSKAEVRPPKPEPAPEEARQAAFEDRLAHVRAMHKRSLTRAKRAATLEKKWSRRLRALERKVS